LELKKVVVSKFYSPATLGQYSKAGEYASLFSNNFTTIIQRVTYPALAQVQGNKTRMVDAYRRVIKITMFVTAVMMFSLGAVSEPLIHCLIGPQWHIAATFLPLVCIYRSMYPLQAINLNMLQVQGRTDRFLYLEISK
jgi:O-antigen/teichoic acid export membrane protein